MMQVFSKEWFTYHQNKLLKFANSKIGRKVLYISTSIPKGKKIIDITPNSFTWIRGEANGIKQYSTDFRTNDKFAKRLYHAFKPAWYSLHFIDWVFSYAPEKRLRLNFGFDTLTEYPSAGATSPVDGRVSRNSVNEAFHIIRAGSGNFSSATNIEGYMAYTATSGATNLFTGLTRSIFSYDTSSLTILANISEATMSVSGVSKYNTLNLPANQRALILTTANPASNSNLVNSDFQQLGSERVATDIEYDDFDVTPAYNDFLFLEAKLGTIDKTGISNFGTMLAVDLDGGSPSWLASKFTALRTRFADYTGIGSDPKLVVTYTLNEELVTEPINIDDNVLLLLNNTHIHETSESVCVGDYLLNKLNGSFLQNLTGSIGISDSSETITAKNFSESVSLDDGTSTIHILPGFVTFNRINQPTGLFQFSKNPEYGGYKYKFNTNQIKEVSAGNVVYSYNKGEDEEFYTLTFSTLSSAELTSLLTFITDTAVGSNNSFIFTNWDNSEYIARIWNAQDILSTPLALNREKITLLLRLE